MRIGQPVFKTAKYPNFEKWNVGLCIVKDCDQMQKVSNYCEGHYKALDYYTHRKRKLAQEAARRKDPRFKPRMEAWFRIHYAEKKAMRAVWRSMRQNVTIDCHRCGKMTRKTAVNKKYCSKKCRDEVYKGLKQ